METQTPDSLLAAVSGRSLARVVSIAAFVAVETLTSLFETYPPLLWPAVAGLVVVFFDAVICARRRWRVLKRELRDGESADPGC